MAMTAKDLYQVSASHENLAEVVHERVLPQLERQQEAAAMLRANIQEITARLDALASREDMVKLEVRLGSRIDQAIQGLLQDALNAIPAKHANAINKMIMIWTAVVAALTAANILINHM